MRLNAKRRQVLAGSVLGMGAVGIGGVSMIGLKRGAALTLVQELSVPESAKFAAALERTERIEAIVHVGSTLNELLQDFHPRQGVVLGLTSDPVAMIAGQLLSEAGGRQVAEGRHSYLSGRWQHQINGASRLLRKSSIGWPASVAMQMLDAVSQRTTKTASNCLSGPCVLAKESPGMLVSWAYELGGNQS